jgi:hypothetical protein
VSRRTEHAQTRLWLADALGAVMARGAGGVAPATVGVVGYGVDARRATGGQADFAALASTTGATRTAASSTASSIVLGGGNDGAGDQERGGENGEPAHGLAQ